MIAQWALKKHPELAHVPMVLDLAKTDADRAAIELLVARLEYGRPFFVPPDVPADRVQALRRAFDATMKDPEFLADAKKLKLEIDADHRRAGAGTDRTGARRRRRRSPRACARRWSRRARRSSAHSLVPAKAGTQSHNERLATRPLDPAFAGMCRSIGQRSSRAPPAA